MPKKSHNSNHNVINIRIDNTKKTKKRKSKRTKHNHAVAPHFTPYSSLTPYSNISQQLPVQQLTNKPYYMELNTINPQLQDIPKPTSPASFLPPPPPPALTDHSDNDDNHSELSSISHHLSYSKIYAGPPDEFHDHIPLPTPHPREIREQFVGAGAANMMKTDYQHQIKLGNRRAQYAEKTAETRQQRVEKKLMKAEDKESKPQPKKKKANKNESTQSAGLVTLLGLSPRETHL